MNKVHALLFIISLLLIPTASAHATASSLPVSEDPAGHVYETPNGQLRYEWPRLSNEYVMNAPFDEITQWVRDQASEASMALHFARRAKRMKLAPQGTQFSSCEVIMTTTSSPEAFLPEQWRILALRVRVGIVSGDSNESKAAYSMLSLIQRSVRSEAGDELMKLIMGNDPLRKMLDQLEEQDTAARILTLSTMSTLCRKGPPPAKETYRILLRRIEESPYLDRISQGESPSREEKQELQIITNMLSSWRIKNSYQGAFDEEFARDVIRIAESLPQGDRQRSMLLFLLGHVHGAPDTVGQYAIKLTQGHDLLQYRMAFLIASRQASFYENKDPASRNIAVGYMLEMLRDLKEMSATNDVEVGMLMNVAGSASRLGPLAVEVADIYIDLISHPNEHVRMMAIDSVGYLGQAGLPALPKLREMADQGGNMEESIRQSIYRISGEGEKPQYYDRMIAHENQALRDAGFILIQPDESDP